MRRTSAFVGWLAIVVAMLCPSAASAGAEQEAVEVLNKIRRAHGLAAMRPSHSLGASADRYARRMLREEFFGHAASIPVAARFSAAGETLAWHGGHAPQPRRTIHRWMASPPHRAALLSGRYRLVGMGMERGRLGGHNVTMWVAHVGRL
jgi:uncharacterized protein YkwD